MVYRGTAERTLVDEVPDLQAYLRPGLSVLDAGSGAGTITLDVAEVIEPGRIIGIDISDDRIKAATALALDRGISNASFELMDAHELQFVDDTFDLVYSYTVAHFWWDPARVLRELKRVAKPGSWVISAGIRDFGFIPWYPACPMSEKVWAGLVKRMEVRREAYRSGAPAPGLNQYWDFHAGRKCVQWYTDAGFEELRVSSRVEDWWYPGGTGKDSVFFQAVRWEHPYFQATFVEPAIRDGFLDQETVDKAHEEMAQWTQDLRAFCFNPLIFVAGRA
jgi:ubiquinone/menaquinone biosynthesis C-methylase UbiE